MRQENPFILIQSGDEHIATTLEFVAHTIHGTLVALDRFDSRDLREAGGAGIGVRHQAGHVGGKIGTHDAVSHAPPGHGVGLGESVEQDRTLLHSGNGHNGEMLRAIEQQPAVDFIREHHDVAIADGAGDTLDIFRFSTPPVGL